MFWSFWGVIEVLEELSVTGDFRTEESAISERVFSSH